MLKKTRWLALLLACAMLLPVLCGAAGLRALAESDGDPEGPKPEVAGTAAPEGPKPTAANTAAPEGPKPTAANTAAPEGSKSTAAGTAAPEGPKPTAAGTAAPEPAPDAARETEGAASEPGLTPTPAPTRAPEPTQKRAPKPTPTARRTQTSTRLPGPTAMAASAEGPVVYLERAKDAPAHIALQPLADENTAQETWLVYLHEPGANVRYRLVAEGDDDCQFILRIDGTRARTAKGTLEWAHDFGKPGHTYVITVECRVEGAETRWYGIRAVRTKKRPSLRLVYAGGESVAAALDGETGAEPDLEALELHFDGADVPVALHAGEREIAFEAGAAGVAVVPVAEAFPGGFNAPVTLRAAYADGYEARWTLLPPSGSENMPDAGASPAPNGKGADDVDPDTGGEHDVPILQIRSEGDDVAREGGIIAIEASVPGAPKGVSAVLYNSEGRALGRATMAADAESGTLSARMALPRLQQAERSADNAYTLRLEDAEGAQVKAESGPVEAEIAMLPSRAMNLLNVRGDSGAPGNGAVCIRLGEANAAQGQALLPDMDAGGLRVYDITGLEQLEMTLDDLGGRYYTVIGGPGLLEGEALNALAASVAEAQPVADGLLKWPDAPADLDALGETYTLLIVSARTQDVLPIYLRREIAPEPTPEPLALSLAPGQADPIEPGTASVRLILNRDARITVDYGEGDPDAADVSSEDGEADVPLDPMRVRDGRTVTLSAEGAEPVSIAVRARFPRVFRIMEAEGAALSGSRCILDGRGGVTLQGIFRGKPGDSKKLAAWLDGEPVAVAVLGEVSAAEIEAGREAALMSDDVEWKRIRISLDGAALDAALSAAEPVDDFRQLTLAFDCGSDPVAVGDGWNGEPAERLVLARPMSVERDERNRDIAILCMLCVLLAASVAGFIAATRAIRRMKESAIDPETLASPLTINRGGRPNAPGR